MPPLIAFAGALGSLAVVRWAYKTAVRINQGTRRSPPGAGRRGRPGGGHSDPAPGSRSPGLTGRDDEFVIPGCAVSASPEMTEGNIATVTRLDSLRRLRRYGPALFRPPFARPILPMDALPAHMRPERSFQGFILALQRFWAEQGCVILQPYDMEMGGGHLPSRQRRCARSARSAGTRPMCSPRGGRRTAAMAKTPTGCSIITSSR